MLKLILRWWQANALSIAFLNLLAILGLSLMNSSRIHVNTFDQSDKVGHGIAYMFLMCTWLMTIHTQKIKIKKEYLFICLALFGILIEVLQMNCTQSRTGDYKDVIANVLGLSLGYLIFYAAFAKQIDTKNN